MALDGLVIYCLVDELSKKLIGGKIEKIYQPENDELILNIRKDKSNFKLLLSANSSNPRAYISNSYSKENPINAPLFCMILRKHIQNGKIVSIHQPDFERIIKITVESLDDLKNIKTKDLIIEIMGKHSNIILVDKDENKIIDAIKRVPVNVNTFRQILPSKTYVNPPSQNKLNPISEINIEKFKKALLHNNSAIFKAIYSSFTGVSPTIAKEICFRSNLDPDISVKDIDDKCIESLFISFNEIFSDIKNKIFNPCMVVNEKINKMVDFGCIKFKMYSEYKTIENSSISFILDEYYSKKDIKERLLQRSYDLRKNISIKLDRLYNKLEKLKQEMEDSKNSDIYKTYGQLITTYMYMIKKGMDEIEVVNFYDNSGETVNIKLDKSLSPAENAQKYFKKYSKLKNAQNEIKQQLDITANEIDYLENIILSIENCENILELDEIKQELIKHGYIKKVKQYKSKEEQLKSTPHKFISCDNFTMYVGKNNKQNDYLTFKLASSDDIWLHTKDIPGSHVIIKTNGKQVPHSTLVQAAILASYFSKARMSSNVAVDFTYRKNVKKPNGAKPGMVIYENNNTLYVTPSEEAFVSIKNHSEKKDEKN
ncbi:Predicted component of the ribosome quality control (RQC) complex, YloA/Tae2 family, contains fibronectin-binding (FbpA) and DUF814 domains [Alkalithermobacter thermoalcaliphilus JW-YL-7 = DSM 7308]|uniref:Rqc2 homolog RqcH n=1 Tax=Alkalithermobacter thermoalcaliphilus JW-YL-7 = DSM 7308 TaxID=1121328 RepID=A0A150FRC2_CLOPD|nr:Fibronectin-binding A domain protein [[Clostridium] paradoxum JW-YL-7 = DSM 7308]SHK96812.1 Predicted component of the ribosome quality control (RQC) complex, YloA/Tae2 family, contains fibronectin-binding (FbpA) and DUF814 domains [[Clostridium] paradoxum JW-YL-7 = DSM 7308]